MRNTDTLALDWDAFWEVVELFEEYSYSFPGGNKVPRANPGATPGYPDVLLQLGADLGCGGFKAKRPPSDSGLPNADEAGDALGRKYTNCCMFAEAALVGTALRTHGQKFADRWSFDHHRGAMNQAASPYKGPPRAYVDTGIAELLDLETTETLEPDTLYVLQGTGHTWLIVDYDPATKLCLRVEASYANEYRPEFRPSGAPDYYGGVAHAGLGRVPIERNDWVARVGTRGNRYRWPTLRAKLDRDLQAQPSYVCMARVHTRPSGVRRVVSMPFEHPETPVRPAAHAYAQNEALDSGFFPLGQEMNIHTGVHLVPDAGELAEFLDQGNPDGKLSDQELAASPLVRRRNVAGAGRSVTDARLLKKLSGIIHPVYCVAPGRIVAARLPAAIPQRPRSNSASFSEELTASPLGFVLVRHDMSEVSDAATTPLVAYSLYFHLTAPNWARLGETKQYGRVPWLNRLVLPAHGAVFGIDPSDKANFGRRLWPRGPAESGPLPKGSVVDAYGESFVENGTVKFGRSRAHLAAVRRDPEPGFADAYRVLTDEATDHGVLTFTDLILPVEEGDLLGFILPAHGRPGRYRSGFLHWEVLAPTGEGPSGLERLFGTAERELGLGSGFFSLVRESVNDNKLQKQELADLLDALPDDDNASMGGKRKLLNPDEEPEYNPELLISALHDADRVQFAVPRPEGTRADAVNVTCGVDHSECEGQNFCHEVVLEVAAHSVQGEPTVDGEVELGVSFEPALPHFDPFKTSISASFDNGWAVVKLAMPAAARRLVLTPPDGVHLESRNKAGDEASRRRDEAFATAQLKSILKARWRHVLVEHHNEWTRDGLERALQARYGDEASELAPFVDELAWWDHNEIQTGGSLFGDSAAQLPSAAETVHNVNPITFAWLVSLLERRGALEFVATAASDASTTAADPLFAGWVPARELEAPFPIGHRLVRAVVLAKGETQRPGIRMLAVGNERVDLGSFRYRNGMISVEPLVPLWGKFELEVNGAAAPNTIGSGSIEFLKPALSGANADADGQSATLAAAPVSVARGRLEMTIPFADGCPDRINGWVTMWVVGEGKNERAKTVGIPFSAERTTDRRGLIDYDGEFIVGRKSKRSNPQLGPFKYTDYALRQPGKSVKISERLPLALQEVVDGLEHRPRLSHVDRAGLRARLHAVRATRVDALLAAAQAVVRPGGLASAAKVGNIEVEVAVAEPHESPGVIAGVFDPRPAYGALLAQYPPAPGQVLKVYLGFLFALGKGPSMHLKLDDAFDDEALRKSPFLSGMSPEPSAALGLPYFGEPEFTFGRSQRKGAATTLTMSVRLFGGDRRYWRGSAKPRFEVKSGSGTVLAEKIGTVVSAGSRLVAHVPIVAGGKFAAQELSVTASVRKDGHFNRIPIASGAVRPSSALKIDTKASMNIDEELADDGFLYCRVSTTAFPEGIWLDLEFVDASTGAPIEARKGLSLARALANRQLVKASPAASHRRVVGAVVQAQHAVFMVDASAVANALVEVPGRPVARAQVRCNWGRTVLGEEITLWWSQQFFAAATGDQG